MTDHNQLADALIDVAEAVGQCSWGATDAATCRLAAAVLRADVVYRENHQSLMESFVAMERRALLAEAEVDRLSLADIAYRAEHAAYREKVNTLIAAVLSSNHHPHRLYPECCAACGSILPCPTLRAAAAVREADQ